MGTCTTEACTADRASRSHTVVTLAFSLPVIAKTASSALALFAAGGLASLGGLPFFILMIVAMYALLILPQQRKQKQWNAMLSSIKTGDRVTTSGGIKGTVITVKDDVVVVRCAPDNLKLEFAKSAIAAVTTDDEAAKS